MICAAIKILGVLYEKHRCWRSQYRGQLPANETFNSPRTTFLTLCRSERAIGKRVVDGADEQGHVLVPRTVSCPLTTGHVDVMVQPLNALHHRLSHCLQTVLLGQLCCYHGNDFLQWTAEETESQRRIA